MSTPHNAAQPGDIAETILLPGDPLRAKFIAETFLEDAKQYNTVRNMFGYTGLYKGKQISVQGTGMGMPSIGIYSYELIHFYGCKNLIRIGSAGSMHEDLKLHDIVFAMAASTNSNYVEQYNLPGRYAPVASFELLEKAVALAKDKGVHYKVGNVLSSDIFYNADQTATKRWMSMGVLAVEMEAAALYMNAAAAGVNALAMMSISDSLITGEECSAEERQSTFTKMMEIALEIV